MLKTFYKILRAAFFSLLVLMGVTFAVSNRAIVDLTFFPLPWKLSVPMFVVAIFLFSTGVITAWLIMRFTFLKERMHHRQTVKRMQALEHEISALRSEQLARQSVATPLSLAK